jgi:ATP-dependent Clp protease adaptor protein ClpS
MKTERPVQASGPNQGDGQGGGQGGDGDTGTVIEIKPKTTTPRRYQVVFHNDDYTTMEFVVLVLRQFFHKSETESIYIMLTVHKKGRGIAGVYTRDVAETKAKEVTDFARENGMPLLVTAEPEPE